jgi:hypothetical protein
MGMTDIAFETRLAAVSARAEGLSHDDSRRLAARGHLAEARDHHRRAEAELTKAERALNPAPDPARNL